VFIVKRRAALSVTIWFWLFASPLCAQRPDPAAVAEGWRLEVTPYLWGPSFKGRVGIGDHVTDVNASFSDLFRELNFAFMGVFEADTDRITTISDFVYMNLSDERATPDLPFSNADATGKSFIFTTEAGYRLLGDEGTFVEVLGGIRSWHVRGELQLDPGLVSGLDVSESRGWVDGIFAVRGKYRFTNKWSVAGYGDIGGGGSNLTYQIIGTASADIGNRYAIVFGYRHLHVAYNKDRFLFDTGMGGPIFGFAFKF
jgi:hypothetical protein